MCRNGVGGWDSSGFGTTVAEQSKGDVLQVLLDTQQLCLDLFDEVEANHLDVSFERIRSVAIVINRLNAIHQAMAFRYAMSGQAGKDFMANVRSELGWIGIEP